MGKIICYDHVSDRRRRRYVVDLPCNFWDFFIRSATLKLGFRSAILAILAPMLLAGCAAFTPSLGKSEVPAVANSYIYGRFYISTQKLWLAMAGHQTIGLSFKCNTDSTVLVKLKVDDEVQVLKVPVDSKCNFHELVFTDADGVIKSKKPVPSAFNAENNFPAGKAYYLGDFIGNSTVTVGGNMINRAWDLKPPFDNYEKTTEEMKKIYPAFATVPTENKTIGR
jgi:hypothetical protein